MHANDTTFLPFANSTEELDVNSFIALNTAYHNCDSSDLVVKFLRPNN